MVLRQFSGKSF